MGKLSERVASTWQRRNPKDSPIPRNAYAPAANDALGLVGFRQTDAHMEDNRAVIDYVAPDGTSALKITFDGMHVADVQWEPSEPKLPDRPLGRAPRTFNEFSGEIDRITRQVATEHGNYAHLTGVVVDPNRIDYSGQHDWQGVVHLSKNVTPDILMAAAVRSRGRKLNDDQKRGMWASTHSAVHEGMHAAFPITEQFYEDDINGLMEEALTEELSHLVTIRLLREQGQEDVVRWAADNPFDEAVLGVYGGFRKALDDLLNDAKIAPEEREEFLTHLKMDTKPGDRIAVLAHALGDDEAKVTTRFQRAVEQAQQTNDLSDLQFVPLLEGDGRPGGSERPKVAGEPVGPGDVIVVDGHPTDGARDHPPRAQLDGGGRKRRRRGPRHRPTRDPGDLARRQARLRRPRRPRRPHARAATRRRDD